MDTYKPNNILDFTHNINFKDKDMNIATYIVNHIDCHLIAYRTLGWINKSIDMRSDNECIILYSIHNLQPADISILDVIKNNINDTVVSDNYDLSTHHIEMSKQDDNSFILKIQKIS